MHKSFLVLLVNLLEPLAKWRTIFFFGTAHPP